MNDIASTMELLLQGVYAKTGEKTLLFGTSGGTRLEFLDWSTTLNLRKQNSDLDFGVEMEVNELALVLEKGEGDGFLNKVLPDDPITLELSFLLGFDTDRGFSFGASRNIQKCYNLRQRVQRGEIAYCHWLG